MTIAELFSEPQYWTKFSLARNYHNFMTNWYSPEAVRFCLHGAILKCKQYRDDVIIRVAAIIHRRFPDRAYGHAGDEDVCIARFNDHRDTTIEDILLVAKEAGI